MIEWTYFAAAGTRYTQSVSLVHEELSITLT
jgi:hypothetical protein